MNGNAWRRHAAVTLVVATAGAGTASAADFEAAFAETPSASWSPWIEFGGYYGSDNASRGEIAGWVPLLQDGERLLFLDARGKMFEDEFLEGNVALGGRAMLGNGWNVGAWLGYDARQSSTDNVFHQISGGVEALGDIFDIRANAYVPLNDSEDVSSSVSTSGTAGLINDNSNIAMVTDILTSETRALALYGVDAEIGAKLPLLGQGAESAGVVLALYGGGFWFDHPDLDGEVAGPKARAELRFNDVIPAVTGSRLTFEAEASWDEIREDRWEIGARLRIPLGPVASEVASNDQWRRMTESIERDTDIVTQEKTTETTSTVTEMVEDAMTGTDFEKVAILGDNDLATTVADLGDNGLLIIDQDRSDGIAIAANQTGLGAGTALQVRGLETGTLANFTYAGARPTITALPMAGDDSVGKIVGSNAHLAGLVLDAENIEYGLAIFKASNVVVDRINTTGSTGAGIVYGQFVYETVPGSGLTVIDSEISTDGSYGIVADDGTTVKISGTTISGGMFGIGLGADTMLDVTDSIIEAGSDSQYAIASPSGGSNNNNVTINGTTFTGKFSLNGIILGGTGNVIAGSGNTAVAATFDLFCVVPSGTGSVEFDGTTYTAGTPSCAAPP